MLTFPKFATKKHWCTSSWKLIQPKNMDDDHLRNTVRMLLRQSTEKKFHIANQLGLKGKKLHKFMSQGTYAFLSAYCPTWGTLLDEFVKRGLLY